MQEIVSLEQSSKKNCKTKNKGVEYKLLLISFCIFISIVIGLLIIYSSINNLKYNVFTGVICGYLFAIIGFFLLILANKTLILSLNKYLFLIVSLLKISVLAIPIIMSAFLPNVFDLWTTLIGLIIVHLSIYISNVKFKRPYHQKKEGKQDSGKK